LHNRMQGNKATSVPGILFYFIINILHKYYCLFLQSQGVVCKITRHLGDPREPV
jgi:hypothetical protein